MAGSGRQSADEALLAALAGGATVAAASAVAGVGERTAWRRLQDDDFRRRLDAAREQTIRVAVDYLGKAGTAAVATLIKLLGEGTPPATRLGAARSIIELGVKLRESQELEARVAALEMALADGERGARG